MSVIAAPQHDEGDTLPTTDEEREQEIARARALAHEWRIDGHMGDGLSRADAEILASPEIYEALGELVLHEAGFPADDVDAAVALGRASPAEMVRDWVGLAERIAAERAGRTLQ